MVMNQIDDAQNAEAPHEKAPLLNTERLQPPLTSKEDEEPLGDMEITQKIQTAS